MSFFTELWYLCHFFTMKIDLNTFIWFRLKYKKSKFDVHTHKIHFPWNVMNESFVSRIKIWKSRFLKAPLSTTSGYLADALPPAYSVLLRRLELFSGGQKFEVFFWVNVWQRNWFKLSGTPGKNISCSSGSVIWLRKNVDFLISTKISTLWVKHDKMICQCLF